MDMDLGHYYISQENNENNETNGRLPGECQTKQCHEREENRQEHRC